MASNEESSRGQLDRQVDPVLHRQFIADQRLDHRARQTEIGRPEPGRGVHLAIGVEPHLVELVDRHDALDVIEEIVDVVRQLDLELIANGLRHITPQLVQRLAVVDRTHDIAVGREFIGDRLLVGADKRIDHVHLQFPLRD